MFSSGDVNPISGANSNATPTKLNKEPKDSRKRLRCGSKDFAGGKKKEAPCAAEYFGGRTKTRIRAELALRGHAGISRLA
jgi:hypothetical protein